MFLSLWCERTRQSYGTAKECSLPGWWMDEWMGWWMDEWLLLKLQKPTSEGWNRRWTLIWSLLLFLCQSLVKKKKKTFICLFKFLSSVTGENEGLLKKILQTWRQSGTVLSLSSFFETPTLNPLLFSTFSSVKQLQSCWYDTKTFFFMFFHQVPNCVMKGKNNKSEWKLVLTLCFTCISVNPYILSKFLEMTFILFSSSQVCVKMPHSFNLDKGGDSDGKRTQMYKWRTDWSCEETQMCVPLTLKDIQNHIETQRLREKTTYFLSPKTLYNQKWKIQTFPLTL